MFVMESYLISSIESEKYTKRYVKLNLLSVVGFPFL